MHAVHNARVQMLANFSNTLGIAFIVTGFVVPAISGQLASGGRLFVALFWIGFGSALDCVSQLVLGRLRS